MDFSHEILISEQQIADRVWQLAEDINRDYQGKTLVMVGILKGSVPFMADLLRLITADVRIDFMAVSSYGGGTESSGRVQLHKDMEIDIGGADVLIIEDIVDTGLTLDTLKKMLATRNPNSVKICTLLNKPSRREADITPDYIGFDIPDEFVIGYGLDFDEQYRNLPFIGVLKQ